MPLYESTFIVRQDVPQAEVTKIADTFSQIVAEGGGKIVKSEYWGLRNLTYRIKKSRKGHYTLLGVDAPAAAIAEMERKMKLSEDVIRFLTVKVDAISEEPSPILHNKSSEGEEGSSERAGRDSSNERENA